MVPVTHGFQHFFASVIKQGGSILLVGVRLVFVEKKPFSQLPAFADLALAVILFAVLFNLTGLNAWYAWFSCKGNPPITCLLLKRCLVARDGKRTTIFAFEKSLCSDSDGHNEVKACHSLFTLDPFNNKYLETDDIRILSIRDKWIERAVDLNKRKNLVLVDLKTSTNQLRVQK